MRLRKNATNPRDIHCPEDNYRNRDKHVVLTKFDKSYEEAQILKSMQKIIQKIKKKITNAEQLLLDFMVDLGRT